MTTSPISSVSMPIAVPSTANTGNFTNEAPPQGSRLAFVAKAGKALIDTRLLFEVILLDIMIDTNKKLHSALLAAAAYRAASKVGGTIAPVGNNMDVRA